MAVVQDGVAAAAVEGEVPGAALLALEGLLADVRRGADVRFAAEVAGFAQDDDRIGMKASRMGELV